MKGKTAGVFFAIGVAASDVAAGQSQSSGGANVVPAAAARTIDKPAGRSPACPGQLIFACTTAKDKVVAVCDKGETLHYTFGGADGRPELAFSVPRARASTDQWTGLGRYISYAVYLPHETYVYAVYFSVDRLTDEHALEAGVNIIRNGTVLATVTSAQDTLQQDLEGIDLAKNVL